jgi:hypothetical protein
MSNCHLQPLWVLDDSRPVISLMHLACPLRGMLCTHADNSCYNQSSHWIVRLSMVQLTHRITSVPLAQLVWLLVMHRQHDSKLRVELCWLMKAQELHAVDCGPRIARLYLGW